MHVVEGQRNLQRQRDKRHHGAVPLMASTQPIPNSQPVPNTMRLVPAFDVHEVIDLTRCRCADTESSEEEIGERAQLLVCNVLAQ